jgi:hypothetical protein
VKPLEKVETTPGCSYITTTVKRKKEGRTDRRAKVSNQLVIVHKNMASSSNITKDNGNGKRSFSFARLFVSSPDYHDNDSSHEHNSVISALQGRRSGNTTDEAKKTSTTNHRDADRGVNSNTQQQTQQQLPRKNSSNRFPVRAIDLRKVNQKVNYMDVQAANYAEDASSSSSDSSNYSSSSNDDDNDIAAQLANRHHFKRHRRRPSRKLSLGVIETGLKVIRKHTSLPSLQIMPPPPPSKDKNKPQGSSSTVTTTTTTTKIKNNKNDTQPEEKQQQLQQEETKRHHSMPFLFMSDESVRHDWTLAASLEMEMGEEPASYSSSRCCKNYWNKTPKVVRTAFGRIPWKKVIVLLLILLVSVLVTWTLVKFVAFPLMMKTIGGNDALVVANNDVVPWGNNTSSSSSSGAITEPTIGMTVSAINRRKLVLEHVIEHDLLPQHPTDPDLILTSPTARKAMNWMTGYDTASMKLLDEYHYYHHPHGDTEQPIELNKHYTMNPEEINQKNKILERYIRAASFFKQHKDANIKNTVLD